jgi:3-carboxy-cis,cis-muconate cycloisomerase
LVEIAGRQARESGKHFHEVLAQNPAVTERLSSAELDRLFAPENYLGVAEVLVDQVIDASHKR